MFLPTDQPSSPPRKLNRSGQQLKRNAACLPCRRRRIKCDAGRPHCSSCEKSYNFLKKTQPDDEKDDGGIRCWYDTEVDEQPVISVKRKKIDDGNENDPKDEMIKELEAKVAELQKALGQARTVETRSSGASDSNSNGKRIKSSCLGVLASSTESLEFGSRINQVPPYNASSPCATLCNPLSKDLLGTQPANRETASKSLAERYAGSRGRPPPKDDTVDGEAGSIGQPLLELLWPGWPSTLPMPATLEHLVDTFFSSVSSISQILNRTEFLRRLALPPSHSEFPHRALLHAICAASARFSAAVSNRSIPDMVTKMNVDAKIANGKGFWEDIKDETCFSERNARYAMIFMEYQHVSGRGLLDICQAMLIITHWCQNNARWMEIWMLVGDAIRLSTCLGLLSFAPSPAQCYPQLRRVILDPPKDDAEREERVATVWMALCFENVSMCSSGWSGSMIVEDLMVPLPASRIDREKGGAIPINPQNYHSPDIYTHHPVADGFVMLCKAKIIMGRVAGFIRQCRRMSLDEKQTAKDLPEFEAIDRDINLFLAGFPGSLKDPVQYMTGHSKGIDADLISAHLVPHVAAIHLHEPFADIADPNCPSARRLLDAAQACLNVVYQMSNLSAAMSYSVTAISSWFFYTGARTLILFYQHALENSNFQDALIHHQAITAFRNILIALAPRNALASRYDTMLKMMMSSIEDEVLGQSIVLYHYLSSNKRSTQSPNSSSSDSSLLASTSSDHSFGLPTPLEVPEGTYLPALISCLHPEAMFYSEHIQMKHLERYKAPAGCEERTAFPANHMGRSKPVDRGAEGARKGGAARSLHEILDIKRGWFGGRKSARISEISEPGLGATADGSGGLMGLENISSPSQWLNRGQPEIGLGANDRSESLFYDFSISPFDTALPNNDIFALGPLSSTSDFSQQNDMTLTMPNLQWTQAAFLQNWLGGMPSMMSTVAFNSSSRLDPSHFGIYCGSGCINEEKDNTTRPMT
ncbi:hypothetical protein C368_03363 [Cryptococcus neoformans 125.91]|nr:hypothetical protein C368_03363 [Cryptococcus neoformans var. grubii 125.91]